MCITCLSSSLAILDMQALLEYEKHKKLTGELQLPVGSLPQTTNTEKEVDFIS